MRVQKNAQELKINRKLQIYATLEQATATNTCEYKMRERKKHNNNQTIVAKSTCGIHKWMSFAVVVLHVPIYNINIYIIYVYGDTRTAYIYIYTSCVAYILLVFQF